MELKKYRAATVREAMDKIRSDLGPDAVILQTKKIPPFDLDAHNESPNEVIEITVAIDSVPIVKSEDKRVLGYQKSGKAFYADYNSPEVAEQAKFPKDVTNIDSASDKMEYPSLIESRIEKFLGDLDVQIKEKLPDNLGIFQYVPPQLERIENDLAEMKKIIAKQSQIFEQTVLPHFFGICKLLIDMEVDPEIVTAIHKNSDPDILRRNPDSSLSVFSYIDNIITRIMRFSNGLEFSARTPNILALVGPTGVGKTTTIAKIAADVALMAKKSVALFSLDTFRIGAQEQLKSYAQIVHIPFEVIHNSEEFYLKLNIHHDKDLILVDTTGRSVYDIQHLKSMHELLSSTPYPIETHLVMSAGTKKSDLFDIVKSFRLFDITNIIFSKLDETRLYGNILNVAVRTQIPVSYITTGQNVPEDIEIFSSDFMAKLLLKGTEVLSRESLVTS